MDELSDEMKHTNVAIDLYSCNQTYNTQLDDCQPHELQRVLESEGKGK